MELPHAKKRAWFALRVAFPFIAAVSFLLYKYGGQLGNGGLFTLQTDPLSTNGDSATRAESGDSWPAVCDSRYEPFTHLRTRTPPLDFQWLALHSPVGNVTLKGPGGEDVPLQKLGTLPLIANDVYSLPRPFRFPPGNYQLFASGELDPISAFPLRPHGCACPEPMHTFSEKHQCSARAVERVKRTVAKWPKNSVTREMYELPAVHNFGGIIHLAVVNNKLYCKRNGVQRCPLGVDANGRPGQITGLIQRVLRRVRVPDVWLMWNLGDFPVLGPYGLQPVFSPSGSAFHRDLLLPTPYMISSKFTGQDILLAATAPPWEEREAKAYFVGSPTGGADGLATVPGAHKMHPRVRAAELAKERPDLLDVTITLGGIAGGKTAKNGTSGFPVLDNLLERGLISWSSARNRGRYFKYVLDLPGNSAAWRLGSETMGWGAMTIKSQTPWSEYWHFLLEDGRNVRLTGDMLDDATDIVENARAHDAAAKCVAREAQLLALLELRQEDLLCWTAHTLVQLSSVMAFVPTLDDPTLIEIPDAQLEDASECGCT